MRMSRLNIRLSNSCHGRLYRGGTTSLSASAGRADGAPSVELSVSLQVGTNRCRAGRTFGPRRKNSMKTDKVHSFGRNRGDQTTKKVKRLEHDLALAGEVGFAKPEADFSIGGQRQSLLGKRRAKSIAQQPLEFLAVVLIGNSQVGVQRVAFEERTSRAPVVAAFRRPLPHWLRQQPCQRSPIDLSADDFFPTSASEHAGLASVVH